MKIFPHNSCARVRLLPIHFRPTYIYSSIKMLTLEELKATSDIDPEFKEVSFRSSFPNSTVVGSSLTMTGTRSTPSHVPRMDTGNRHPPNPRSNRADEEELSTPWAPGLHGRRLPDPGPRRRADHFAGAQTRQPPRSCLPRHGHIPRRGVRRRRSRNRGVVVPPVHFTRRRGGGCAVPPCPGESVPGAGFRLV